MAGMKKTGGPLWRILSAVKEKSEKKLPGRPLKAGEDIKQCAGGAAGAIDRRLENNLQAIAAAFHASDDLKIRRLEFGSGDGKKIRAALVFLDGLADGKLLAETVVEPLLYGTAAANRVLQFRDGDGNAIRDTMLAAGEVSCAETLEEAVYACLTGDCAMFVDGLDSAVTVSAKGYEKRSIQPSDNEVSIRGPKESFIENLRTNTALLRRRIKNSNLCFESMTVGRQSKTPVTVAYMAGIADQKLVDEVKRRIAAIDIDAVIGSSYIEQLIADEPLSLFPTVGYTERPDVLCAGLMEGRVGILVDGSPHVLTVPHFFTESFQSAEDYFGSFCYASLIRILRYAAFFFSTLAPALYVALSTFHQELIPTALLLTMSAAKEGIPFSAFFEALMMMLVFEILKEAGVRLPQPIGQTISIVGALVMGEAAVSAGFVSAPLVIVIAFTAVSGFVVTSMTGAMLILRIVFLFLGGVFGGYGIAVGVLVLLVRLASMRSFGCRYLTPFVPFHFSDQKDNLVRLPLWVMRARPLALARRNRVRENTPIPPDEPEGREEQAEVRR